MENKRYLLSGINYKTGKRIAIMRNDITQMSINGSLACIEFKNRPMLYLYVDKHLIIAETDLVFFLNRHYRDTYGVADHAYSLQFNN